jgi:hypothetical protein
MWEHLELEPPEYKWVLLVLRLVYSFAPELKVKVLLRGLWQADFILGFH